jgi:hypothetical protein
MFHLFHLGGLGVFALGVGAAVTARAVAPAIGRWARPAVRGVVKEAVILSQGVQVRAAELREDLEDLVEEVRDEAKAQSKNGAPREDVPAPGTSVA